MKRIFFLAVVVILLLVAVNIAVSIISLWGKKDLLLATEKRLSLEKREKKDLEQKLQVVSSSQFVEEEARDKLFMAKPGEVVVLFPTATQSGKVNGIASNQPIWQQWLSLFVY